MATPFNFKPPKTLKIKKIKSPKALKSGGLSVKMSKLATTKAKKKATIKSILRGFAK